MTRHKAVGRQSEQNASLRRILVIRLGALGDFVQSFGPFQAIRQAHPNAHITLLTTAPFAELGRLSPWFDSVAVDARASGADIKGLLHLRAQLQGYDRIYDLQTSGRTARYRFLAPAAEWCGHVGTGALVHRNPWRNDMHTRARQRDQLRNAGMTDVPAQPDVTWLREKGPVVGLPYAVLVPGAAPHRPGKRWPAERYGQLARKLVDHGLIPVVVGTQADQPLAQKICHFCPQAQDLTGRTSLPDLAGLLGRAELAVGNDTGPMHLAAIMGVRCLVLFSADSNPALTAPLGASPGQVCVFSVRDLAQLSVDRVAAALLGRH